MVRRWSSRAGVLLVLGALVAPAPAQEKTEVWSDVPVLPAQKSHAYITWSIGAAFIVGCLLIAFKNPHRSHLD